MFNKKVSKKMFMKHSKIVSKTKLLE